MSASTVQQIIDGIIEREGGGKYTFDPNDSGGPTRWGITERTARAHGYAGDMRDFPRASAVRLYLALYWSAPGFSTVHLHHPELAVRLADFGVLAGPGTPSKQLQRCLNVLNRGGKDYKDVPVDGKIGLATIGALNAFLRLRGADGCLVILGMVAAMQSVYLLELAERRPKDEEYQFGWQLNRAIGAVVGLAR